MVKILQLGIMKDLSIYFLYTYYQLTRIYITTIIGCFVYVYIFPALEFVCFKTECVLCIITLGYYLNNYKTSNNVLRWFWYSLIDFIVDTLFKNIDMLGFFSLKEDRGRTKNYEELPLLNCRQSTPLYFRGLCPKSLCLVFFTAFTCRKDRETAWR